MCKKLGLVEGTETVVAAEEVVGGFQPGRERARWLAVLFKKLLQNGDRKLHVNLSSESKLAFGLDQEDFGVWILASHPVIAVPLRIN